MSSFPALVAKKMSLVLKGSFFLLHPRTRAFSLTTPWGWKRAGERASWLPCKEKNGDRIVSFMVEWSRVEEDHFTLAFRRKKRKGEDSTMRKKTQEKVSMGSFLLPHTRSKFFSFTFFFLPHSLLALFSTPEGKLKSASKSSNLQKEILFPLLLPIFLFL